MNLLKHPLVCINTSTAVTRLYHLKCAPSPSPSTTRESGQLWRAKLVYYLLVGQVTLRGLLFTIDSELLYNPLAVFIISQYPFVNSPLINSLCLVSCWGVFIDYAFSYNMDSVIISNTYQLLVENGRYFRALNGRTLGWPKLADKAYWQLWRLPVAYLALGKRIWTLSGGKTELNDHSTTLKFHITQLGVYSTQLRGKLLVYSNACEAVVIFCNLLIPVNLVIIANLLFRNLPPVAITIMILQIISSINFN
ncbi:hypothetical protein TYRP_021029 [Tyrophagus putrescentiae]|nr:hypothetical protein TYRP_008893 [Tyrophagus putrescentiae]KAH9393906.1 hypothetical protein TYRP_021029 [Tyrophagus putrescentiae]